MCTLHMCCKNTRKCNGNVTVSRNCFMNTFSQRLLFRLLSHEALPVMLLKLLSNYSVRQSERRQLLQRELHTAVGQHNIRQAQQLLDDGARANQRSFSSTGRSETPLLAALINGNTAMAHVLLEAPSTDVNSLISCAHTPLQYSALAANWPMVQTLLTHGANPSVSTETAPVPLALATSTWPHQQIS
jgi:ankyrin repeat protein